MEYILFQVRFGRFLLSKAAYERRGGTDPLSLPQLGRV